MEASRQLSTFYKGGDVFDRDEQYYRQLLVNTRKSTNNVASSSVIRQAGTNINQRQVDSVYHPGQPQTIQQTYPTQIQQSQVYSQQSSSYNIQQNHQNQQKVVDPRTQQLQLQNDKLRAQVQNLVNGKNDFGTTQDVVKLSYYHMSQTQIRQIQEQQAQLHRLQQVLNRNNTRIQTYKKATTQLQTRMNNIQSIDRQIYKNLQGAINRDKDLLDKASSALARGQKRQDIAHILEQIITS